MKSKVTINMDSYVVEEAKLYKVNISKSAEEAIKSYLNIMKGDVRTADEMLLRRKMERAEKQLIKLQGEISGYRSTLQKIEDIKNKTEEERLIEEKEEIEKQQRCINCGNMFGDEYKWHEFDNGKVCRSCFLNARPDDIRKWSKDESKV